MTQWPNTVPPDLRHRIASVLALRSVGPAEVWSEVRDWLAEHAAVAPPDLPTDEAPPLARPV